MRKDIEYRILNRNGDTQCVSRRAESGTVFRENGVQSREYDVQCKVENVEYSVEKQTPLHSTLYTLHSKKRSLHSTLYTLHSKKRWLLVAVLLLLLSPFVRGQQLFEQTITVYPVPTMQILEDTVCADDSVTILFTGIAPFEVNFTVTKNGVVEPFASLPTIFGTGYYPLTKGGTDDEGADSCYARVKAGEFGKFVFTLTTFKDSASCDGILHSDSVVVLQRPSITMLDTAICYGESARVHLEGVAPFEVYFNTTRNGVSTGIFRRTIEASEIDANGDAFIASADTGVYGFKLLSLTDRFGCDFDTLGSTDSATVTVNPYPTVAMVPDTTICQDEFLKVTFTGVPPFTVNYTVAVNGGTAAPYSFTVYGMDTNIAAGAAGEFDFTLISLADNIGCTVTTPVYSHVKVNPKPIFTNSPLEEFVCSAANRTAIKLYSDQPDTLFSWTTTQNSGNITGFLANGSGDYLTAENLTNTSNVWDTIVYHLVVKTPYCVSDTTDFLVIVYPQIKIDTPAMASLSETICSGDSTSGIRFASNLPNATYSWTSEVIVGAITGYTATGTTDSLPAEALTNTGIIPARLVYKIIPISADLCVGDTFEYVIDVNPTPQITLSKDRDTICSGDVVPALSMYSTIGGTTFDWESTIGTDITITGGSLATGTGNIPPYVVENTNTDYDSIVFYITGTTQQNCYGDTAKYVLVVRPTPVLDALTAQTICSQEIFDTVELATNITGGSLTAVNYQWQITTQGAVGGLTQYSGATDSIFGQTLYNYSNFAGKVVYHITPYVANCAGDEDSLIVNVDPKPLINNLTFEETICSNSATAGIALISSVAGSTFDYTAVAGSGITGLNSTSANGVTANLPSETLQNTGTELDSVVYQIVAKTAANCESDTFKYVVYVQPVAKITAADIPSDTICSGGTSKGISAFTSQITSGTVTYTWTTVISGNITGLSTTSGAGAIPAVTLVNHDNVFGEITYTIVPTIGGCAGIDTDYVVVVKPTSDVVLAANSESICAGATTAGIALTSSVANATFGFTATASSALVTLTTTSGTNVSALPSEIITSTADTVEFVTYKIWSDANGCAGDTVYYTVYLYPAPQIANTHLEDVACSGNNAPQVIWTNNISDASATYHWIATSANVNGGINTTGVGNLGGLNVTNTTAAVDTIFYKVWAESALGCQGDTVYYNLIVNPTPSIATLPASDTICSGDAFATIVPTYIVSGTTFNWTATVSMGTVSGLTITSGQNATSITGIALTNIGNTPAMVTYRLTPNLGACTTVDTSIVITVNPQTPAVPATVNDTICSGATFTGLTLNPGAISGAGYVWTATYPATITGSPALTASGYGSIQSRTLTNTGATPATLTFNIRSYVFNGGDTCYGNTDVYSITVGPALTATASLSNTICSGDTMPRYNVPSSAYVVYNWTANVSGMITGLPQNSGTGNISNYTLTNKGNTASNVTFSITPYYNGCNGIAATYSVTVNPELNFNQPLLTTETICSGSATSGITFTTPTSGTISWTAVASSANIPTPAGGSGGYIPALPSLINSATNIETLTYKAVINAGACHSDTSFYVVTVNPTPHITNVVGTDTICSGQTFASLNFTFDVANTKAIWKSTINGDITGINPTTDSTNITGVVLNNYGGSDGTVVYTITPYANGCAGADSIYIIVVKPIPTLTNAVLSQTICSGTALIPPTLTSNVNNPQFEWITEYPTTITGATANGVGNLPADVLTTSNTVADTVKYRIVVVNNDCNLSDTVDYTVIVMPAPTATLAASDTICENDALALITLTGTAPWTVVYNDGTANQTIYGITSSPYNFIPASAGVYTFTLVSVTDAGGCTVATTGSATVLVNPLPTITLAASQNITQGDSVVLFTLTGVAPWELTYFDGTDTIVLNINASPYVFDNPIAGTYDFTIISLTDANCSDPNAVGMYTQIVVDSIMLPFDDYVVAKWNNTFLLNLKKLDAEGYCIVKCTWYENGVMLDTGFTYSKGDNVSDIFVPGAVYHFELTLCDGRILRSTDKIYVTDPHQVIILYPNPVATNEEITIDLGSDYLRLQNADIQIYSANGSIVKRAKVTAPLTKIQMNLAAGIYMVKVETKVFKVVVK